MRVKREHNGKRIICMSASHKPIDDLLMSAMDTIKDANGQPGILEGNFIEGTVMLHGHRISH